MKYCNLGRTGLKVSRLCLGTGNFGLGSKDKANWGSVDEKESYRIMDAALDAGINFFDTANVYGGTGNKGLTEEIIGRWFKKGNKRREKVVLGTKVGREFEDSSIDGPNNIKGLSLYKIRRHLEASLKRLQTDHIELYQMHTVDRSVSWEEVFEAFESAVKSGVVDYIGSSNFCAWDLMKAQNVAKERKLLGIVCEQHRYDLLNRFAEFEVMDCAKDQGIGITIFSPLWRGLLGINFLESLKRPMSDTAKRYYAKSKEQLTEYSKLCNEIGEKVATVTIAWELANPNVTAPIIGPCSVQDLLDCTRALEIKLEESVLDKIDEIFPLPSYFQ